MQRDIGSFDLNNLPKIFTRGSEAECKAAADQLVDIGAPAVVPLIKYLETFGSFFETRHASDALVRIGEPAIEHLNAAMSEGNDTFRRIAVGLLARIGGQGAVTQIVSMLSDPYPEVALAAAEALASMDWQPDSPELEARYLSVIYLYSYRKDAGAKRQGASEKLQALAWEPENDEVGAAYYITNRSWKECVRIGLPAVKPLFITLQDPEAEVAESASGALIQIGSAAVNTLIALLDTYFRWSFSDSNSIRLRTAAAGVLGGIGDAQAVPALIRVGSTVERTSEIREAAADALAAIGTDAVETLMGGTSSTEATTQQLAAMALGRIGDKRAMAVLVPLLSASAPHHPPFVRNAAYEALKRLAGKDLGTDPEAWQALLRDG